MSLFNQPNSSHFSPSASRLRPNPLLGDEFWRWLPPYKNVDKERFFDHRFQIANTVYRWEYLEKILRDVTDPELLEDIRDGVAAASMNLRITPYILSLIDWNNALNDPLRIQFIPLASTRCEEHPFAKLDSLRESFNAPIPGVIHRYPDRVLFLALDSCPIYCQFCTRNWSVGGDTLTLRKIRIAPSLDRWKSAFSYIASNSEVRDVIVSGGDTYMLSPNQISLIGETFLRMPNIQCIRFASRGLAVMPMKILSHQKWTDTLARLSDLGRSLHKQVFIQTHFNSPREITEITKIAADTLFERGVRVRNQTVLIRGVNNSQKEMADLLNALALLNIEPYYVYLHDMTFGTEEFRTTLREAIQLEKQVRGMVSEFNSPLFVVDLPGGGGKRDIHSFEYYDPKDGISVYRGALGRNSDKAYFYFDPIQALPKQARKFWNDPELRSAMVKRAKRAAGF